MAEADPKPPVSETVIRADAPAEVIDQAESKPRRRWGRIALMLAVPMLLLVGGGIYWQSLAGTVSTDNAYLKQDKVSISAEVGGRIIEVTVAEGEDVAAGDLLFRIDPEPFRLQVAQANAAIAGAQANVTALTNDSALSGADISAAREQIAFAQSNLERQQALWNRGFTTKADYEAAQHSVAQAREGLRAAQARSQEARARLATGSAVPGENPQVAAAKVQRETAQLNLSRSEVRAPMAGRIAEADRLQTGQQVMAGLPIMTLVASNTSYVEANFKETDLAKMAVGQAAEIRFDAYPDLVLEGHVTSIGAGTGSEFSILPAQNATGNWVKVTQRVPVRIAIDSTSPRVLIAGLSSDVTVYTDGRKR